MNIKWSAVRKQSFDSLLPTEINEKSTESELMFFNLMIV